MKQIIKTILLALLPILNYSQDVAIETLDIISRPIDTLYCNGDTISVAYFNVQKTSTDNGTIYPDVSIDTILVQNGGCPVDSTEILRILFRDATEIQNRAAHFVSESFQAARRDRAKYLQLRTLYNNFTGDEMFLRAEDAFWATYEGKYRIVDINAGTSVTATMIRLGATKRYRLRVDEGQVGAGTPYVVIPLSRSSFQVNGIATAALPAANYVFYQDKKLDVRVPVFFQAGYIESSDVIRIVKIQ